MKIGGIMISVCLCTYNGEKVIRKQINSILSQSMLPNEIVIFDDASTDDTVYLIKEYINAYPKVKWKLKVRTENCGWKTNFYDAINSCNGDYIFLCDQDDFWYSYKVKEMVDILESNDKILLLSSNYYLEINNSLSRRKGISYNKNVVFVSYKSKKSIAPFNPGCTYCFKKELVTDFNRYWNKELAHDRVLWCVACVKDGLYIYNNPCINWVRTGSTASAVTKSHFSKERFEFKVKENYADQLISKKLIKLSKELGNYDKVTYYCKYLNKVDLQHKLYKNGKIKYALKLFFKLHWYRSFKSYLQDFIAFRFYDKSNLLNR